MSAVSDILRAARARLATEWTGPAATDPQPPDWTSLPCVPTCRDSRGRPVGWRDEGVAKFTVPGAIAYAAAGDERLILAAWDHLTRAVAPVRRLQEQAKPPPRDASKLEWAAYRSLVLVESGPSELEWFEQYGRTLPDVTKAFDKAINAALGER